ncbi:hypothetical protein AVEN_207256-1, partial [Araneus ventricosus]
SRRKSPFHREHLEPWSDISRRMSSNQSLYVGLPQFSSIDTGPLSDK